MAEESRFSVRRGFFLEIHKGLRKALPEIFDGTQFDERDEQFLIALYFLMSDSYKRWRVQADHNTNDVKKAGLTIAAVMAMRPVTFPGHPDNVRQFFLNPIFAIAGATAILRKPIYREPDEDIHQTYMWLDRLRFPSTGPFLIEALAAPASWQPKDDPAILLNLTFDEISSVDLLVHRMKVAVELHELRSKLRVLGGEP